MTEGAKGIARSLGDKEAYGSCLGKPGPKTPKKRLPPSLRSNAEAKCYTALFVLFPKPLEAEQWGRASNKTSEGPGSPTQKKEHLLLKAVLLGDRGPVLGMRINQGGGNNHQEDVGGVPLVAWLHWLPVQKMQTQGLVKKCSFLRYSGGLEGDKQWEGAGDPNNWTCKCPFNR